MTPRERTLALIADVAASHKVDCDQLLSRRRSGGLSQARRAAYRALTSKGLSARYIASIFGRERSTVAHGLRGVRP
jgi:chromosomal replication initiation ATPase DnaA